MDASLKSRIRPSEVLDDIIQGIGGTPLVRLPRAFDPTVDCAVLLKIEALNPTGCVKSRIAALMVERAEASGELRPGSTIIECTSGNTGVGLCLVAAVKGYRAIMVMPDKMSQEKVDMLKAYGAEVVLTPSDLGPEHPQHYLNVAERLTASTPGAWHSNQFCNPANPDAHFHTTGPEIWQACDGRVDLFVGGCGTGGTVHGTARFLKQQDPAVRILAVDPPGSVYAHYWATGELPPTGSYAVEGVGDDMIPDTWNRELIDAYEVVEDRDSFAMTRRLAAEAGLFVGGSSGMALCAALRHARQLPESARVVVLLPDSGNRYLSKVYSDDWLADGGFTDGSPRATATIAALARTRARAVVGVDEDLAIAHKHRSERNVHPLPVVVGDCFDPAAEVVGILDEERLRRHLVEGTDLAGMRVGKCMAPPPPVLGPEQPWQDLSDALDEYPAVLLRDATGLVGFTRADLLRSLPRLRP